MLTAPPHSDRFVVGLAPGALGMVSAITFYVLASCEYFSEVHERWTSKRSYWYTRVELSNLYHNVSVLKAKMKFSALTAILGLGRTALKTTHSWLIGAHSRCWFCEDRRTLLLERRQRMLRYTGCRTDRVVSPGSKGTCILWIPRHFNDPFSERIKSHDDCSRCHERRK